MSDTFKEASELQCKDCHNYMCTEIGNPFLRDKYREECRRLSYRLYLPPRKEGVTNER